MTQPSLVSGKRLFPYQLEGLKWGSNLFDAKRSGILGDEMGLGKTLTTVSIFSWIIETKGIPGPFIVVCPLTLVDTWDSEVKTSAPSLKTLCYMGAKGDRDVKRQEVVDFILAQSKEDRKDPRLPFNILITTYEIAIADADFLKRFKFRVLAVDEGHRLKNSDSLLYKTLNTEYQILHSRLILTGTPMQNNLKELWSLLHFCDPKAFPTYEDFKSRFPKSKLDNLKLAIKPYLLRRQKCHVELSLPTKKEAVVKTALTKMQRDLYRSLLVKDSEMIEKGSVKSLSNVVMHLRKACNHPYLFEGVEPEPFQEGDHLWENSGKLAVLDRLLPKLRKGGHKVLIFSQMTRVLDILQDYLNYRKFPYERLDGSVRGEERFQSVKKYSAADGDNFVFLLSTRAGGQGLNLVAADTVIFFDIDWNPQRDAQAQERVYRIGQTQPVLILRFITAGSLEEVMFSRASAKLLLSQKLVGEGDFVGDGFPKEKNGDGEEIEASKDDLWSAILYGIANLLAKSDGEDGGNGEVLTDEDVDEILDRSVAKEKATDGGNAVSSSMEISSFTLEEGTQGEASLYSFEGEDYSATVATSAAPTDADEAALRAIIETEKNKNKNIAGAVPPTRRKQRNYDENDDENPDAGTSGVSAEEKRERAEEKKKQRWERDGYVSLALTEVPDADDSTETEIVPFDDDEDSATAGIERTQSRDLICLTGDASKPQITDGQTAIVLCSVDTSGDWPSMGFFGSVTRNFGTDPKEAYERAKKFGDLKLGDVHLVSLAAHPHVFVALSVLQKRNKDRSVTDVLPSAMDAALPKILLVARKLNASVHSPCLSPSTWYSLQRLLRKHLSSRLVPTYIYYFTRRSHTPHPGVVAAPAAKGLSCSAVDVISAFEDVSGRERDLPSDDEYDEEMETVELDIDEETRELNAAGEEATTKDLVALIDEAETEELVGGAAAGEMGDETTELVQKEESDSKRARLG